MPVFRQVRASLKRATGKPFKDQSRLRRLPTRGRTAQHERSTMLANPTPRCLRMSAERPVAAPQSVYPLRSVGQVVVELSCSRTLIGVATLVSDYTILTAGCLLKTPDNQFRDIRRLSFVPAPAHVCRPYGIYDWSIARAVYDTRRNWALISLTEPAGQALGFLGTRAELSVRRNRANQHATHISFCDDVVDRMSVRDVVVRADELDFGRRLVDGVPCAAVPGEPVVDGFGSRAPLVLGLCATRRVFDLDPVEMVTGYEYETNDGWMKWLCEEFGRRHASDRFACQHEVMRPGTLIATTTTGATPYYTPFTIRADDAGPRATLDAPIRTR